MQYIRSSPNESGAYPAPQSTPFPGALAMTDEQAAQLVAYNGFVAFTAEDGAVTAVTPELEAWEEWKSSLPPEPDPEPALEDLTLDLLAEHEERLCMLEIMTAQ